MRSEKEIRVMRDMIVALGSTDAELKVLDWVLSDDPPEPSDELTLREPKDGV